MSSLACRTLRVATATRSCVVVMAYRQPGYASTSHLVNRAALLGQQQQGDLQVRVDMGQDLDGEVQSLHDKVARLKRVRAGSASFRLAQGAESRPAQLLGQRGPRRRRAAQTRLRALR